MLEIFPMQASPRRVDFIEGYHVRLRAALNRGEGRLMTLSQGGAYVATPVTLLPQAQLSVAIEIPELARTVEVEAVVAWENRGPKRPSTNQPDGYGIRFIRVPYASAEAIYWLLRREEGPARSHDPEKTQALTPWEIQEAMERAQKQFGTAATSVPVPVNPFEEPEGPPYRLISRVLLARVPRAPGVIVLAHDRTRDARVERADEDLRRSLSARIGDYPYFHFEVIPKRRARFERECELYHRLGGDRAQLDNREHPLPPPSRDGSQLKCPVCVKGN
jgi:PilZ domain